MRERERLYAENAALRQTLTAAAHALRSYEMGNGSPDLARTVVGEAELVLAKAAQAESADRASEGAEGRP